MHILEQVTQSYLKSDIPPMRIGDTLDVHVRILEEKSLEGVVGAKKGDKEARERIQVFTGVLIARKHSGIKETITVRRIVAGEGVERVFPLHSPVISKIEVVKSARVRQAKLYYLRDLFGKKAKLRERWVRKHAHKEKLELPGENQPSGPEESAPETESPVSEEKQAEPKKAETKSEETGEKEKEKGPSEAEKKAAAKT